MNKVVHFDVAALSPKPNKRRIGVKTRICTVIAVILVLYLSVVIPLRYANAADRPEADQSMVGRYQLRTGDNGRCFKIDTVTGRVWLSRGIGIGRTNFEEIK